MKHSEHIAVFDSEIVERLGFNSSSVIPATVKELDILHNANDLFSLRQRRDLDAKEKKTNIVGRFKQILPYVTLTNSRGEFLVYQRGSGIGENRLLGNFSIGFGGHVDITDVVHSENGVINIHATLLKSTIRELDEELILLDGVATQHDRPHTSSFSIHKQNLAAYAFIDDNSNDVGKDHLALCLSFMMDDNQRVLIAENELTLIGWKSIKELKGMSGFESWSQLLIDQM